MSVKYAYKKLEIDVPIIGVFGSGESTNKHLIQKKIDKKFSDRGYDVISITSKVKDSSNNAYEFPKYIFQSEICDRDQIIQFNHFVYKIYKEVKPDIIIIEVPQGIVPISNFVDNGFGTLVFKITNAMIIDIGIMSVYFDEYTDEFFNKLETLFLYRFSIDTLFFNLHKKRIDWLKLREKSKVELFDANEADINRIIECLNKSNIYRLDKDKEVVRLTEIIETKLLENAYVTSI